MWLAGLLLAAATLWAHWLFAHPSKRVWTFALLIDLGWVIYYGELGLVGPLLMSLVFLAIHGRNRKEAK